MRLKTLGRFFLTVLPDCSDLLRSASLSSSLKLDQNGRLTATVSAKSNNFALLARKTVNIPVDAPYLFLLKNIRPRYYFD